MTLSRVIASILITLSALIVVKYGGGSYAAFTEFRSVSRSAVIAEARALWLDALVALSLERSLTELAVLAPPERRDTLTRDIAGKRLQFDASYEAAVERIRMIESTGPNADFLTAAERFFARLRRIREEVDIILSKENSYRSSFSANIIGGRYVDLIDWQRGFFQYLRAYLPADDAYSTALLTIQERAWFIRELSGRARTPYATAIMTQATHSPEVARRSSKFSRRRGASGRGSRPPPNTRL